MVDNGASVNATTKFDKYTSLIDASLTGNFKIVQILIEKGANVNATTKVRYSKNLLRLANLERYFQFQKGFLKFSILECFEFDTFVYLDQCGQNLIFLTFPACF